MGKKCVYLDMPDRKRRQGESRLVYGSRCAACSRLTFVGQRFANLLTHGCSRVAALESKVDRLISQLSVLTRQSTTPTDTLPKSAPSASSHQDTWSSVQVSASDTARTSDVSPSLGLAVVEHSNFSGDFSGDLSFDVVERGLVDLQDTRERLERFRNDYVPYHPFTPIRAIDTDTDTLDDLRRESPATFLAIMAVTETRRPSVQVLLGEKLWRQVSSAVLHGKSSLDLLRGSLIYAGWYHYFCGRDKPLILLLLQLCTTLVHELGFDKRPARRGAAKGTSSIVEPSFNQHEQPNTRDNGVSWDGKRALLGTFWLSVRHVFSRCLTLSPRKPQGTGS